MERRVAQVKVERRTRSGSHLLLRGAVYHYRRIVPEDARRAFGRKEVTKSLGTSNVVEAKRLEKSLDVEFEAKLSQARAITNPELMARNVARGTQININFSSRWGGLPDDALVSDEDQLIAMSDANEHLMPRYNLLIELERLLAQMTGDQITEFSPTLLSIVRQRINIPHGSDRRARSTTAPTVVIAGSNLHTIEWAYDRWLRKRSGRRVNESIDRARAHLSDFLTHSGLVMLADVRRSHLLAWRDSLVDAGKLAANSINHRITFVGAILRTGWADAEMPEQNLRDLVLPTDDEKQRVAWSRDEILTALNGLKPGSWSAWLYLIGLTTGARIGEPTAARVSWFNPRTGMIEVDDPRYTKANKKHVMPVIECLRGPLFGYIEGRSPDDFLFDCPRPANPKIPVSHEVSKWFGRFFDKQKIDRVFHELRHTWIEEARHSTIDKDVWEIISGHSGRTVSDRYGGKKPDVLLAANETICGFLTRDAEVMSAVRRLTS